MRERTLRRRCRSLLRDLDIRPPLDMNTLCARIGEYRRRPIELYRYEIKIPGPFGLWFAMPDRDAIFFQASTSRPHQDHIIAHELGHILAQHPSDEGDVDEAVLEIRRDPPTDGIGPETPLARRTCYDSDYEAEAEIVATIILEWASVLDSHRGMLDSDPGVNRMARSLSHHQGWL